MNKDTKDTIKALIIDIAVLVFVYSVVVIALALPIAFYTTGIVTIVMSKFASGVAIYVAMPVLMKIDNIKFVKFDKKAMFSSFQFFFIGGAITSICAMLPWMGVNVSESLLNIISMITSFMCSYLMARDFLSMYDM